MGISNHKKPAVHHDMDIQLSIYAHQLAGECSECTSLEFLMTDIHIIHQDMDKVPRGNVVIKCYCLHCHNVFYMQFSVETILDSKKIH